MLTCFVITHPFFVEVDLKARIQQFLIERRKKRKTLDDAVYEMSTSVVLDNMDTKD